MTVANSRAVEVVGNNLATFYWWNGNVSNVSLLSASEVQFEIHVGAGFDTPTALPTPCVDAVSDPDYQNSASMLNSVYTAAGVGVFQNNSGQELVFNVTTYEQILAGGEDTFIPLQEVKFLETNGTVSVQHFLLGTNTPYVQTAGTTLEFLPECVEAKRTFLEALPAHLCTAGSSIPAGYTAYTLQGGTIAGVFAPATNASNLYIHAIFESVNGQGFDVITGAIFTATTPGIIATDLNAVQLAVDNALVSAGFSAGQVIYAIDVLSGELVFWHDPAVAPSTLNVWAGDVATSGGYTNKVPVDTLIVAQAPTTGSGCSSCREVQLEKWLEVDGVTVTEELYEIGNRTLVIPLATEVLGFGGCPQATYYPYSYETCADIASVETVVRVFELRDATGAVFNRIIELADGTDVSATATLVECGTCCDAPMLLPINRKCDSYSRSNNVANNIQNSGGWLSGYNNGLYQDKWTNTATYDQLMIDTGNGGLAGAPRQLQYQVSGEINGVAFSGVTTVAVPTAGNPAALASAINAIAGATVLVFDSYGWAMQYNTAWTSYSLLIREFADNHAGGFQDISGGRGWAIRLNGSTLEEGINVNPNDFNDGKWFLVSNCVAV